MSGPAPGRDDSLGCSRYGKVGSGTSGTQPETAGAQGSETATESPTRPSEPHNAVLSLIDAPGSSLATRA
jgi:hypothetical protein